MNQEKEEKKFCTLHAFVNNGYGLCMDCDNLNHPPQDEDWTAQLRKLTGKDDDEFEIYYDFIRSLINKEREKTFDAPMGVTMWQKIGLRFGYAEFWAEKVKEEARQDAFKEVQGIITETLKEFANTPLDKRKSGWDWILKVKERITSLSQKSHE